MKLESGHSMGSARRQRGGETVEFALLAWLVFLLLFSMIAFFIGLYNQGAVLDGARVGTREAALYWVDTSLIDSGAEHYRRLEPARVETATLSFLENFGVGLDTSQAVMTLELCPYDNEDQVPGSDFLSCFPVTTSVEIKTKDKVRLALSVPFSLPGVGSLPWIRDLNRFHAESNRHAE